MRVFPEEREKTCGGGQVGCCILLRGVRVVVELSWVRALVVLGRGAGLLVGVGPDASGLGEWQ